MTLDSKYNSFSGTWIEDEQPKDEKIIHHAGSSKRKIYDLKYI